MSYKIYSFDIEILAGAHCLARQTTTDPGILICGCQISALWTRLSELLQAATANSEAMADKLRVIFLNTVHSLNN